MDHCERARAFDVTCHCAGARDLRLCFKKIGRKFCEKNALEPALECGASSKKKGQKEGSRAFFSQNFLPIFLKQSRRSRAPAQWHVTSNARALSFTK